MADLLEPPVLLLAIGNDLRGDDAGGWQVAAEVSRWHRPGVRVLWARQLVPELAADVADAATVVLIDASLSADVPCLTAPETRAAPLSHGGSFGEVLALARSLGGRTVAAWVLGVPAESFECGADPSPRCRDGIAAAVRFLAAALPPPRNE